MAEIVDLTADSPPDAPQPANDSAVIARLELFTGASADAAREAMRAHGNDADAAASALLSSIPDTRATDDDLAAIRRLRDEENASTPLPPSTSDIPYPKPSVKEMKATIAAAGLATADLLERADVEARYAEARAPAASDDDLAAIRRLREEQNGSMAEQLAEARRKRAAHHASRPPPVVKGELRVATYNVWFEHEDTFAKRMAAIARECAGADIVGFQEVTDDSFPYLEAALKRQGFRGLLKQAAPAPYYCCLASKKPLRQVRTHHFQRSMMGRGILLAVASWGEVDVHVGVVHLESFVGKEHDAAVRAERKRQLAAAGDELQGRAGTGLAVLLGDCNWDDRDGAVPLSGSDWRDAWEEAGYPREAQYTYDGRKNRMLSHRYQNRYDRVFLFDGSKLVCSKLARVAGFALIGTARLPDLTITDRHQRVLPAYPSDHFGALATLAPAGQKPSAAAAAPKPAAAAKPVVPAPALKPAPKQSAAASFFAPRTKRTKTTAAVKYRGAAIPDGWELVDDALLVGRFGGAPRAAQRIAGFDFDDTLSPLDWGRPGAWSHLYGHAPRVIRQLAADGHAIVVLSNECLDRYKRLYYLEKKMRDKCSKVQAWAADVSVPVLALVALSKQDETRYHKSQGDGMWRKACEDRGVSGGFYVGDSADDESLARFAGVPFHHVKEFFERMHKS